ncbi:MAG: T9SS type A sorting domain-containing protein [Ignavibacteriae bacterium]|nr:T9SS type A sorting domain-containing protein [Ignavibacteriota bacterium]
MKRIFTVLIIVMLSVLNVQSQTKKFLFDATKYQTAANADWVIDENLSGSTYVTPRYPTPLQSTITSTTAETYWTGALSSWGIALVKLGHQVESLPVGTAITYGNASNPQDLSNYNVFIVDEPNSPFTATEKTAMLNFVYNGGGLFMISDHNNADRNGDGWDALAVWNNFMRTNSVGNLPFGFKFDSLSFSETSNNVLSAWSSNPILNGPQGAVNQVMWSAGTSMTIYPAINPNVKGLVWRTGVAQGSTSLLCISSTYGTGRVVAFGDSSPADDGSGSPGHTLYNGWLVDAGGNHARLHLNASLWLAKLTGVSGIEENNTPVKFSLEQNFPNPFNPTTNIKYSISKSSDVSVKVFDIDGKEVAELVNEFQVNGSYSVNFNAAKYNLASGVYYAVLNASGNKETIKMLLTK